MNARMRIALAGFAGLLTLPALIAACGSDGSSTNIVPPAGQGGAAGEGGSAGAGGMAGQAGTAGSSGGICLLNNCKLDTECAGCGDSRTKCNPQTKVCIACQDPGTPCPAGQKCTQYGTCVASDKTCPADPKGVPTIKCVADTDCDACDPAHRVCDTTKAACVGCSPSNLKNCLQSDYCKDNKCTPKCPQSCTIDGDCNQCGTGANAAHACNNHKCAKCSPTFACDKGMQCINGSCVPPCGLPGPTAGTCDTNEDCLFCGAASGNTDGGTTKWDCKFPLNGANHGACVPTAGGCSDVGVGAIVLPEPWSNYTNTCSNNSDCKGQGPEFNVGKQIRDWIGSDSINIGIGTLKIGDANVTYGMNVCADFQFTEKISCGLCVPCKVDTDCKPIGVDKFIGQIFSGQPLAQLAGAFLIDMLYGDNPDHDLNFFCQPIAAGYGVCVPCANPMNVCAKGSGPNTGKCDHDVCTAGTALKTDCGDCAAAVCKEDAFCCDGTSGEWDSVCVGEVDKYCAASCGGGTTKCDHNPCTAGTALASTCSACVTAVCANDPFCCNTQSGEWDSYCVKEASDPANDPAPPAACANACTAGCAHPECEAGAALKTDCSACATAVCTGDDFCCTTEWDSLCVDAAKKETACSCQ
jgi:hypothetical protein